MTHEQQTAFESIVGKEEIAHNEQFLHFPKCFLLNQIIVPPFVHIFDTIFLFAAELEEPKIGIQGKGLRPYSFRLVQIQSKEQKKFDSNFENFLGKGLVTNVEQGENAG